MLRSITRRALRFSAHHQPGWAFDLRSAAILAAFLVASCGPAAREGASHEEQEAIEAAASVQREWDGMEFEENESDPFSSPADLSLPVDLD